MKEGASLRIRPVEASEFESAGQLVADAYATLGDNADPRYFRELREVAVRVRDSDVLVAELDGRIVGCVTYVDGLRPLSEVDDPDAATIRMLGVAPEARGRGVGEALVRECIDRARRSGCRRVRLDTRTAMTAAQRLYERLGFQRDEAHDWSPAEGVVLLAFVLEFDA